MPKQTAKNVSGNSENFTNFMRRLMRVPHSEIKAKLDAEIAEKETRRTPKPVSRVPAVSFKVR